jgi:hypothetical protein
VPLRPSQLASLVLRVVAARHLDQNIAFAITDEASHVLTNARGQMVSFALGAGLRVKTASAIGPYLLRAASDLSSMLVGEFVVEEIAEMIVGAARTLEAIAIEMGNRAGDCGCELVNVTSLVERRAFRTYESTGAVSGKPPPINFETEVIEDAQGNLEPFRVAGSADITISPRIVRLTVKDGDLTAWDLCHLAYVLHHELFCHAFQAIGAVTQRNAPPQCYWTEGWMDRLAFVMAVQWAEQTNAPHAWLPLTGPDATGAMTIFHEFRYENPKGLKFSDAKNRRAARQAFHALVEALIENGMAKRRDDAESLVFRFSLLANAHPNADLATLRRICLYFQNNLLSRARKAQTGAVALACIEFLRHRDLGVLETDLARDPYTPTIAQARLQ